MAYTNQQNSFWDWAQAFNNGAGVDHPAEGVYNFHPYPHPPPHAQGFRGPLGDGGPFGGPFGSPFGGPFAGPFGGPRRGGFPGHRGRRGRRGGSHERGHGENEQDEHSETEREGSAHPPEGPHPHDGPHPHGHHGRGRHGRRGGWGGPGHRGPPPQGSFPGALNGLLEAFSAHPLAMAFQNFVTQAGQQSGEVADPDNSFTPPIDIFSTPSAYVLHVALPGAKKEDVGVHWDNEKRTLNLAGVVYRQGDEEFLKTLSQSERRVGEFERAIKLPPGTEEKEEVDGEAITAKLEDGVLVVTVPKLPKDSEWTEVKRVDVQ